MESAAEEKVDKDAQEDAGDENNIESHGDAPVVRLLSGQNERRDRWLGVVLQIYREKCTQWDLTNKSHETTKHSPYENNTIYKRR